MRRAVEVPYWIVVGVLTIVGIYFSVLYDSPPYFFWAALVLALIGVWWPGPRYSWVALIGFGGSRRSCSPRTYSVRSPRQTGRARRYPSKPTKAPRTVARRERP